MSRSSTLLLAGLTALAMTGCGGDKSDFSAKPTKFTIQTASPADADSVIVNGFSRDGRVIGTFMKAGVKTVFGWTPDGDPTEIVPPTETKELVAINELGGVLGADRTAVPQKLFRWQGGATDPIKVPANATFDSFGAMTYDSFFLVNLHVGAGKTRGYQLTIDEAPKAITGDDGAVLGSSLNGNIAGFETIAGKAQAVAYIDKKKVSLGPFGAKPTQGWSVNDDGLVVGSSDAGTATSRAFKWSKGKYSSLVNPTGATATAATDVTNGGVIGGEATIAGVTEACVWYPDGKPILVKTLVTVPAGVHLDRVKLVTPLGILVCEGTRKTGAVTKAEVFGLFPEF